MDYAAYVINLPQRTDRRQAMTTEVARAGLYARFWEGVDASDPQVHVPPSFVGPRGAYGCLEAHRSLLTHHLETVAEPAQPGDLVVLEDDVALAEDFVPRLEALLAISPRPWDVLYLGGQHLRPPTNYGGMRRLSATMRNWGYVISAEHLRTHAAELARCDREVDHFLLTRQLAHVYVMPVQPLITPVDSPSSIRPESEG